MREKIKDKGRLEHILNSIDVLISNKGKYEFADVEKDPIIIFGFVKLVEIIGEAVYMLTPVPLSCPSRRFTIRRNTEGKQSKNNLSQLIFLSVGISYSFQR